MMLSSNYAICGSKKLRFIKEQEVSELLSSLGIRTLLRQIPIVGPLLFQRYKMNKMINKFLLAGNKFMFEKHLRQPGFTNSNCRPFTKNKKRIQK